MALFAFAALAAAQPADRKLTDDDKIDLIRGLTAEYATVKTYLPRSKKALEFKSDGTWNKSEWREIGGEFGPVAREGEMIQITKINIENDKIVLEINGGLKTKSKWWEHVEVGMGGSGNTTPVANDKGRSAGTSIALIFPDRMPVITAREVKKMLTPILDFEKHSATENYLDTIPPEIKEAILGKKALVGMDREQVKMALGLPRDKIRETNDGLETEDWIYGLPPGKISFITFANGKVIKIKDSYAGMGGSTAPPLKTPVQ